MVPRPLRALASTALLLCAGACNQDPFERPGTWQPIRANERNLQQMVANPGDLSRGMTAPTERGSAGANAATRLLTERRRPLPAARASLLGGEAQQQGAER